MFGYSIGRIFNVVLLLAAIIGILQPAFSGNVGLTQIILALFEPQWTQEFLMKWLLVLAFGALLYSLIIGIIFKNIPITIIWTRIDVTFNSGDGSDVEIYREQLLRANQPSVTAFFSAHTPSDGHVPHERITASAHCDAPNFDDRFEIFGRPNSRTEVFHVFPQGMPYAWYMPLIPIWILNRDPQRLPKFIRKNLVLRRNTVAYVNEYNVPKPTMDFSAPFGRYYQHNITWNIMFKDMKIPTGLRIMRIKENGVIEIKPERKGIDTVIVRSDTIRLERIRITWAPSLPDPGLPPA
jgi:hypothetical protein